MTVVTFPETREVRSLLEGLLGREVKVTTDAVPEPVLHPSTMCGLVDDENVLRCVLGCDLPLAHLLGASIALIPALRAEEATEPDADLLANYREVANVLSRSVNERAESRVRIDPGMAIPGDVLISCGNGPAVRYLVDISGYGTGVMVVAAVV